MTSLPMPSPAMTAIVCLVILEFPLIYIGTRDFGASRLAPNP